MKLSEVANPRFYVIKQWLDSKHIEHYTIGPDGVVDVNCDVELSGSGEKTLPVQFGNVTGDFLIHIRSLSSLQGMPHTIGGDFSFFDTKIISCSNIHKIVKRANGMIYAPERATHILGLLIIEGATRLSIDINGPIDTIMNKHRKTKDIVAAQDELIDAGFREQAKL